MYTQDLYYKRDYDSAYHNYLKPIKSNFTQAQKQHVLQKVLLNH